MTTLNLVALVLFTVVLVVFTGRYVWLKLQDEKEINTQKELTKSFNNNLK